MSNADLTASELCQLANQYELGAAKIVKKCIDTAKAVATSSGKKEAALTFNSQAVTDAELASATAELERKGFRVSSARANGWLSITVNFDVCG